MADESISAEMVAQAERLAGLEFTEGERALMLEGLAKYRDKYRQLRQVPLGNGAPPAQAFAPCPPGTACAPTAGERSARPPTEPPDPAPAGADGLAFAPLTHLARLLRDRQVSSVELTTMYLERLSRYDPLLHCVVTLTEDLALAQARRADEEMAAGHYRGPLHGVPWGAKDLLATRGIRTTWGAEPYVDQVPDEDATVVARLAQAGAVLVAKLSLGALAWGDVWFGGKTRNPWNPEAGSSGSSAGSGAATAAGLVGFAIGSETCGSILSPSVVCGITGLRPTFGRVSRHGAMTLSWSMDKIGPMCRSAEDCALVFDAIRGPDGHDETVVDGHFAWPPDLDRRRLRVGYLEAEFAKERPGKANDAEVLAVLERLGARLMPVRLPEVPVQAASFILEAEAAAAFDELTRSGRDDLLARQGEDAWPNVFRQARLIPAVEYIQANRVRRLMQLEMARLMETVDVYLSPAGSDDNELLTNLTGHPAVALPNGLADDGTPTGIVLVGRLNGEAELLAVACAYQQATDHHRRRPPLP